MKSKPTNPNKPLNPNGRKNWAKAFKRMAKNGDDVLMDAEFLSEQSSWDKDEWLFDGLDDKPFETPASDDD